MRLSNLICKNKENNLNVEEFVNFFNEVKNEMISSNWLGDITKENVLSIINEGGDVFVYYFKENIICALVYLVANEKSKEKFNLKYKVNEMCACGPVMVNKNFRGNKLQIQMLEKFEELVKLNGKKYIFSTVHPLNKYSINNFIKLNYKNEGTLNLKRGTRSIFIKKIL